MEQSDTPTQDLNPATLSLFCTMTLPPKPRTKCNPPYAQNSAQGFTTTKSLVLRGSEVHTGLTASLLCLPQTLLNRNPQFCGLTDDRFQKINMFFGCAVRLALGRLTMSCPLSQGSWVCPWTRVLWWVRGLATDVQRTARALCHFLGALVARRSMRWCSDSMSQGGSGFRLEDKGLNDGTRS